MIELQDVSKQYGTFRYSVSMAIPEGRITGIIGKNGAGKSTTIKMILGLVRPDSGVAKVFGRNAGSLTAAEKQQIGTVFSDSGFSMYLTVENIIQILKKLYAEFDEEFFRRTCRQVNLPLQKQLKDFSTGMKAKLRVLMAISHKARLLVLDEPTAGLDVEARNVILDLLRRYMEEDERRTILISSHISSDLEGLCDDIYLFADGGILLHEDMDVILDHYAVLKMDGKEYEKLDKNYLLCSRQTSFGYICLTGQKQFYMENYKNIVVEKGNIDELILLLSEKAA